MSRQELLKARIEAVEDGLVLVRHVPARIMGCRQDEIGNSGVLLENCREFGDRVNRLSGLGGHMRKHDLNMLRLIGHRVGNQMPRQLIPEGVWLEPDR